MNIITHGSCTAKITPYPTGYECLVVDRLGNDIAWTLHATTMPEAVAEVEQHFKYVIRYLRGFIILPEFLRLVA